VQQTTTTTTYGVGGGSAVRQGDTVTYANYWTNMMFVNIYFDTNAFVLRKCISLMQFNFQC
jgi:hypothetical protein